MAIQRKEHLYQIWVYNSDGSVAAVYDDLVSVMYTKFVNKPGLAVLTAPPDHDILNYQDLDRYFEIYWSYPDRSLAGTGWHNSWQLDYAGIFRDVQFTTDENGNVYAQVYLPSLMSIIDRYVIAYPAGSSLLGVGQTVWGSKPLAEIVNDVVRWNCTEEALVVNNRIRDIAQVRGFTDDGAIAGTTSVSYSVNPGRPVLEFIQELAPILGFDFDVFYDDTDNFFHCHQYEDQLGTDKSATIFFDLALDNVSRANQIDDRLREKTVAVVGGPGEGLSRTFVVRTGVNYASNNESEVYVDARSNDASELNDIGDAAVGRYEARVQAQNQVRDSLGWTYARDYQLGDLVTISFAGIQTVKKIGKVEIVFDQTQRVSITIEFIEP